MQGPKYQDSFNESNEAGNCAGFYCSLVTRIVSHLVLSTKEKF